MLNLIRTNYCSKLGSTILDTKSFCQAIYLIILVSIIFPQRKFSTGKPFVSKLWSFKASNPIAYEAFPFRTVNGSPDVVGYLEKIHSNNVDFIFHNLFELQIVKTAFIEHQCNSDTRLLGQIYHNYLYLWIFDGKFQHSVYEPVQVNLRNIFNINFIDGQLLELEGVINDKRNLDELKYILDKDKVGIPFEFAVTVQLKDQANTDKFLTKLRFFKDYGNFERYSDRVMVSKSKIVFCNTEDRVGDINNSIPSSVFDKGTDKSANETNIDKPQSEELDTTATTLLPVQIDENKILNDEEKNGLKVSEKLRLPVQSGTSKQTGQPTVADQGNQKEENLLKIVPQYKTKKNLLASIVNKKGSNKGNKRGSPNSDIWNLDSSGSSDENQDPIAHNLSSPANQKSIKKSKPTKYGKRSRKAKKSKEKKQPMLTNNFFEKRLDSENARSKISSKDSIADNTSFMHSSPLVSANTRAKRRKVDSAKRAYEDAKILDKNTTEKVGDGSLDKDSVTEKSAGANILDKDSYAMQATISAVSNTEELKKAIGKSQSQKHSNYSPLMANRKSLTVSIKYSTPVSSQTTNVAQVEEKNQEITGPYEASKEDILDDQVIEIVPEIDREKDKENEKASESQVHSEVLMNDVDNQAESEGTKTKNRDVFGNDFMKLDPQNIQHQIFQALNLISRNLVGKMQIMHMAIEKRAEETSREMSQRIQQVQKENEEKLNEFYRFVDQLSFKVASGEEDLKRWIADASKGNKS